MERLVITAELQQAPVLKFPVLLDGLLLAAIGEEMGMTAGGELLDVADVVAAAEERLMPLLKVVTPWGWWFASSAVPPQGRESRTHLHRRAPMQVYEGWTQTSSVNIAAGPDKGLRVPVFRRVDMTTMRWTCIGDKARVAALLARVPGIGPLRAHGHGHVLSWDVSSDPDGPGVDDYASDPNIRHVPVEACPGVQGVVTKRLPLRPPYWRFEDSVALVAQVAEVFDVAR